MNSEPYFLTPLGQALAFVEVGVLPLLPPNSTRELTLAALQESAYCMMLSNVERIGRRQKEQGDTTSADRLLELVRVAEKPVGDSGSAPASSARGRSETEGGALRSSAFHAEFCSPWVPPLASSVVTSQNPADVVKADEEAQTQWGTSPIFSALRGALPPTAARWLLSSYEKVHRGVGPNAAKEAHSAPNAHLDVLKRLERFVVVDGLHAMLLRGPTMMTTPLDLGSEVGLISAVGFATQLAVRCGVPSTVIDAALASPADVEDVAAINRWRLAVLVDFVVELIFPSDRSGSSWLPLFIQRWVPVDVADVDEDEGAVPQRPSPMQILPEDDLVSAVNIEAVMASCPEKLPRDVVRRARKDVFGGGENAAQWPKQHPIFHVSAWELEHHFTMDELRRLYAIILPCVAATTVNGSQPPRSKSAMAALICCLRDGLKPVA